MPTKFWKPKKSSPTKFTLAQIQATKEPYAASYGIVEREFGINLAEQSKLNFRRLFNELKDELKKSHPDKKVSFSPEEHALWKTWREKLVPLFTVKHATHVNFDKLTPLVLREEKGEQINNAHTTAFDSIRSFSYFVFNIGPHHPTPHFLPADSDTIQVSIGSLSSEQKKDFTGLWIGGHYLTYQNNSKLPPCTFGNTLRQVSFDKATTSKTITYTYQDGTKKSRKIRYEDEIFCADKNMAMLFDALFFQFILELHFIGGEFQQYIYQHPNDVDTLTTAFHSLFQSAIYPEAKLPLELDLKKPYVALQRCTDSKKELYNRWFTATMEGDVKALGALLSPEEKEGASRAATLLNAKSGSRQTALVAAIQYCKDETKKSETIRFLLNKGIDITPLDSIDKDALSYAIEKDDIATIRLLTAGIVNPKLPLIRQKLNTESNDIDFRLQAAIKSNAPKAIEYFLDLVIAFSPQSAVIAVAYHSIKDEKYKLELIEKLRAKQANINAANDEGYTPLMTAAKAGDRPYVAYFIEQKAEINKAVETGDHEISVDEGKTALHLTAEETHLEEVVADLLRAGAQLEKTDFRGNTAYFCVENQLSETLEQYQEQHPEDFLWAQHTESILSMVNAKHEKNPLLQEAWQEKQTRLKKIKAFFEERGANKIQAEKTELQQCDYRKFCCVAIITGIKDNQPVVVMGRKRNIKGKAFGYYVLPGGLKDNEDKTYEAAIQREVKEEVGIEIADPSKFKLFFTNKSIESTDGYQDTCVETLFFHIDLGEQLQNMRLSARDDLTDVVMLPWPKITVTEYPDNFSGHFYNKIRIKQSNFLLCDALFRRQAVNAVVVRNTLGLESYTAHDCKNSEDQSFQTVISWVYQGIDLTQAPLLILVCLLPWFDKTEEVDRLIAFGADVNQVFLGVTPLMAAIKAGKVPLVWHLIKQHHADVNVTVENGSALALACSLEDKNVAAEIVDYLLQRGFNFSQNAIELALLAAASSKSNNIRLAASLLTTNKINLNEPLASMGARPLFIAAQSGCSDIVRLFLNKGADIYFALNEKGISFIPWVTNTLATYEGMFFQGKNYILPMKPSYQALKIMVEDILAAAEKLPCPSESHETQRGRLRSQYNETEAAFNKLQSQPAAAAFRLMM